MQYTDEQRQAISHRGGNLLILACAGSGKTEVISRRIAMLVTEGVPRDAIVAFTFTERAAAELKARIRRQLEDCLPLDPAIGGMYVGTIHGYCLQILKELEPSYRKFEVMDDVRQAALVMANFHKFENSDRGIGLNLLRDRTKRSGFWDTVRTFLTTVNVVHQKGIELDRITDIQVREALRRYRQVAYDAPNYFFDFDQIIGELLSFLSRNPLHLERLRSRYQYLVMDEYQDVDGRQEELLHLLSDGGRRAWVTAVGDDDQAIYGWRGARIENILTFRHRYPKVAEVKLVQNFRSTHAVVEIANAAVQHLPQERRVAKAMEARHWNADQLRFVETLAHLGEVQVRVLPSEEAEGDWIGERIETLRGTLIEDRDGRSRGLDYADFAILLRSVRSSGRVIANALRARGIPVVVKGTGGLFDQDEVRLIQATFCLLARTEFAIDEDDGRHRYDEPGTREFVRQTIRRLRARGQMPLADDSSFLLWIARKREELDRRELQRDQRGRLARRIYPQDIFQEMLAQLGAAAGQEPWPQDILFNLGRLSGLLTQFEAVHQWVTPRQLVSLCLFLGGWAAGQVDQGGLDEAGAPNAVQILTIHAAKGLEWPAVFIPRVASATFPSSLRNRGPATFLDSTLFDPSEYAGGDDGERRLWYVALTRCRRYLHITSPDRSRKRPSEFISEIHHDIVQRDGVIPEWSRTTPAPPADLDLLPTTYTDLSYFWRCPFEYQLRSLMGFGPGVRESYGYGQQIHNVLAEIHLRAAEGTVLTPDEAADLVEQRFHLRYTRDGEHYRPLSLLRDAAKASIRRYLQDYPDSARFVLEAERPFEFVDRASGALISGTIDLLERLDRNAQGEQVRTPVAVVDFKTHRWRDFDSYSRSVAEVEDQLRLYAIAAGQALGFDAQAGRARFLSPRGPSDDLKAQGAQEGFEVDISEPSLEGMRTKVRHAVAGIEASIQAGRFELRGCTSGHCPRCDFRRVCPGYSRWTELDRQSPRPPAPEAEREAEVRRVMEDLDAG